MDALAPRARHLKVEGVVGSGRPLPKAFRPDLFLKVLVGLAIELLIIIFIAFSSESVK